MSRDGGVLKGLLQVRLPHVQGRIHLQVGAGLPAAPEDRQGYVVRASEDYQEAVGQLSGEEGD